MTAPSAPYGHVCNYKTGEQIRAATQDEWNQSVIGYAGCFVDPQDGKTVVYVDGGPGDPQPGHFIHDEGPDPQDGAEATDVLSPAFTSTITNLCKSPDKARHAHSISGLCAYGAANRPEDGEWFSQVRARIETGSGLSAVLTLDPLLAAAFAVDLLEAACFARGLRNNPIDVEAGQAIGAVGLGRRPVEPLPADLETRISKLEDLLAGHRLAELPAEER